LAVRRGRGWRSPPCGSRCCSTPCSGRARTWRHPPADPIEAARAALRAALDEIDAEVTKADEVRKTAGERTTLLVEQQPAALA
jgi:hypothetical protein